MNVVMVHGAGGGGWEWRLWGDAFLAAGACVFAPDLRPAASGIAATTFNDYRAQVAGWLSGMPAPAIAVGASLGGLLALAAAGQASSAPAAIVLVNPVPPLGVEPRPRLRRVEAVIDWSRSVLAGTRAALPDADLLTARWAHERWRDESGAAVRQAIDGIAVPRPGCPTLVVGSSDDGDIPPTLSRATAGFLEADFILARGCSHVGALLGEGAAATAHQVLAWCRSATGG